MVFQVYHLNAKEVLGSDPLSPLLFVLATDLLQSIINHASRDGTLQHPLGPSFGGDFPFFLGI